MTKNLNIGTTSKGKAFTLPLDLITQTVAILAKRGVGKTTTGAVISEELMDAGQRICVIDPTGAHWGLKSTADGKGAAYPVVIFGGEHADAPLEKSAGEVLARAVAEGDFSCIIDLSAFRKGETIQFLTSFFEEIYRLNRRPLHLVCDEADTYAPQKPLPNQLQCLGAIEDVIKKGRIRGLGATLITLRSAIINKNVLTMCEVLVAMRAVHPLDIAPVKEWVSVHGDPEVAKTLIASLPSLPVGTAWFYSPGWGDIFERVQVRPRRTFDSSATPKPGVKVAKPKVLAKVDMERLSEQIRATIEDAKANSPAELKKKLAAVQAELAKERAKPAPKAPAAPKPEIRIVKVPVITDAQIKRLEQLCARMEAEGKRMDESRVRYSGDTRAIVEGIRESVRVTSAANAAPVATQASRYQAPRGFDHMPRVGAAAPATSAPIHSSAKSVPTPVEGGFSPTNPQRKILNAMASLESIGVTRPERGMLAAHAGVKPTTGSYANNISALKTAGLIDYPSQGMVSLTDAGRQQAEVPGIAPTLYAYHRDWCELLTRPQAKLLRPLLEAYPESMTRAELAEKVGVEASTGSFANNISAMKTIGCIDYPRQGLVAASALMFPAGLT